MQTANTRSEQLEALGVPETSFPTPQILVPDAISANATWYAHKTALVCGERRVTWRDFNARVNRVANALLGLGMRKGDKISILMPNGIEMAEVMCGIVKMGGVLVPLSASLAGPALVLQINDSDSQL